MKLTAIVLTFNEAKHLARCLTSVRSVTSDVLVVDSFSTDDTVEIARRDGARVVQHPWINHALQFNWALTQVEPDTSWVLRIDADEILTEELADEIRDRLPRLEEAVAAVSCGRRMTFQRRLIRFGGLFPIRIVRLFRYGRGACEKRWMDEHIKVDGEIVSFDGEIIDDSLHSLSFWTEKHNQYASREAVDLLNLKYKFMPRDSVAQLDVRSQAGFKRWVKEQIYARSPRGARAFAYFAYRYVFRLGFLDGRAGLNFHVFQGFWYRFLVDAKVGEVERHMDSSGCDAVEAIRAVLGIDVSASSLDLDLD